MDALEGFNFIYIKNDNRTYTFIEELSLTGYEGVEIIDNNNAWNQDKIANQHNKSKLVITSQFENRNQGAIKQQYQLTVPPKSDYMILLRTAVDGFQPLTNLI